MNIVQLDKKLHKNLKLKKDSSEFLSNNSVFRINASEINKVFEKLPVFFIDNSLYTITKISSKKILLDTKKDYIPNAVENYPFLLVSNNDKTKSFVCFDKDTKLLSNSGKQLFNKNGTYSKLLKDKINNLNEDKLNYESTLKLIEILVDNNLLTNANITAKESNKKILNNFKIVDINKLKNLPKKTIKEFEDNGIMAFINYHIKSLKNFSKLV